MENQFQKKPRILCLHGHGASAKILEEEMSRWPEFVLEMMDLVYIDAPYPVERKSGEEFFEPPYYEWFQANEHKTVYKNFDECIAYIEQKMIKLGPFDGVLGVSQGAAITAALPGMQREGVALINVPRIKFVIIISGNKFGGSQLSCPELAKNAFSSPIDIPSLQIIGEKDRRAQSQFELLDSFVNPTLLYHHEGHGVPHLDNNGVKIVLGFLNQIQRILYTRENIRYGVSKTCCFYLDFIASLFCFRRKSGDAMKRARVQNLN